MAGDLSPPTFCGSAPADPLSTSNPTDLEDLSAPSLPSARPGHGTAPSAPARPPATASATDFLVKTSDFLLKFQLTDQLAECRD